MQVILPDEQIHQIQLLLSNLIRKEISEQLDKSGIESPYLKKNRLATIWEFPTILLIHGFKRGFHPSKSEKPLDSTRTLLTAG